MTILPHLFRTGPIFAAVISFLPGASATEYFVNKRGNDANAGTSPTQALATIQKAVGTLQPGDTLTIGPGEYHEAVKRIDLGSEDADTIIRAEIPGTVVLRGDVPAPAFRPLQGHRFVYVADFPFTGVVPAVNELDTLTIMKRMPNSTELEFIPGAFYHDAAAGKLYISTSDMRSSHRYSVSTLPAHGVLLVRPRRVVIEGLAVTGFHAMELQHYREETAGGIWGIYLVHGHRCVIRDCHAYLNAWGIGMNSGPPGCGDNVIERCVAWANKSAFANGDMGGITVFAARRDVIRDCTAYLNGMYGINIYGTGGAPPNYKDDGGNEPQNRSLLRNNLAWGNETADLKIKTGYEYHHVAERCVSPGLWSVANVSDGLIGRGGKTVEHAVNSIDLSADPKLDPEAEFADPVHHDYRLQSTSRFRGAGADGRDAGPIPYAPNVFYVRFGGDDRADGLSVASAWKTLGRAVSRLRPGDTIYLDPGTYESPVKLRAPGEDKAPIFIRGRGNGRVIIAGPVQLEGRHVTFERLRFRDEVKVHKSQAIQFNQCRFTSGGTALEAGGVDRLKISHCQFGGVKDAAIALSDCSMVDLSGNLYNNSKGPALRSNSRDAIRYSDYNNYSSAAVAWQLGATNQSLAAVQATHDNHSQHVEPELVDDDIATLDRAGLFAGRTPLGKPLGQYHDAPPRIQQRLVSEPKVHSLSATTANIEWTTRLPANCHLAWGETPACANVATFEVNYFGTYSLTGLKPGQTYYFKLTMLETPKEMLVKTEAQTIAVIDDPLTFTTLSQNPASTTYYVAPDGDDTRAGTTRQTAWKSIRHAAAKLNVGDTALIAGGKYVERIRLRATGEKGSPITFRAMPGERVDIDGDHMMLNSAFVSGGKSHLRFDGFYFAHFNLWPNDGWGLQQCGEFHLYRGRDIQITRCFSEGRGGYSAAPLAAWHVEDLLVQNCVNTYKFAVMYFWRCPNLQVKNTVFAGPMIMSFVLRNEKTQKATMENCIFTDMLDKKARLNLGLLCCDGEIDGFLHRNNCYLLRDCIPLEQRALNGKSTINQLGPYILDPLFADPLFAGDPGMPGNPKDKSGYGPDRMMDATFKVDFNSFFATNPEVVKRGMGLQPEAFQEFHFNKPAAP